MHRLLPLLLFVGVLLGCTPRTAPVATETFGTEFEAENVTPAASLTSDYSEEALTDSVRVTLSGTVNEVCQAKGCWMTLEAGNGQEMMVQFADYGFFVPKDISGREVTVHGVAYYQITPVEELRHLAEDGGDSPEEIAAILESKRELRFLADGVRMH